MVLGLSSAGVLLCDMLSRKRSTSLKLREFPNMPLLYVLAVVGALIKPRWTDAKTWPALKVCMSTPITVTSARLSAFRKLTGWPAGEGGGALPMMAMMAEGFRLVMQVLTLPAFPVSVLGTVVNKRARYCYMRAVAPGEALTFSCSLNPTVRQTFSGHAEFDLLLEAVAEERGDVVWQAVLTLVLMNPRKGKGKSGQAASGEKDSKQAKRDETPPATMAAGQPLDTWKLPENTGRAYAALDGDISPMHLYKATAMLMGFPAPVANVHLLAARAEASIAANKGAAAAPLSLELEFKKPVLLPAKLSLLTTGGELSAQGGLALRVDDAKGRPLATGVVSSRSAITCF